MKYIIGLSMFLFMFSSYAKTYTMKVTDKGFEPSSINVSKNEDVVLNVTRLTDSTCAMQITVPSLKLTKDLPLNKEVTLKLGRVTQDKVKFGCGMGMMLGGVVTSI